MHLLVVTRVPDAAYVLPALPLLSRHTVGVAGPPADPGDLVIDHAVDAVLVDGRTAPGDACALAATVTRLRPTLVVVSTHTVRHVGTDCAVVQLVLDEAGPAEVDARLRLATRRDGLAVGAGERAHAESRLSVGTLTVDLDEHHAEIDGCALDLPRREFDLLAELVAHAGRTMTRRNLLWRVWGPGYEGSARTVDVHVRGLRAALGPEHADMIRTVRGSGYLIVPDTVSPGTGPGRARP